MSIWSYSTLYRSVHSSKALENWTGQQNFNNRKFTTKIAKTLHPCWSVFPFIFSVVLAFIRYIGDCARYNENFVISRSCSVHFTVTLAGLKDIVRYTKDFIIWRIVKSRFHCTLDRKTDLLTKFTRILNGKRSSFLAISGLSNKSVL